MRLLCIVVGFAVWLGMPIASPAQTALPSLEEPAQLLQQAVVTVRVQHPTSKVTSAPSPTPEDELAIRPDAVASEQPESRVTVCSGVSLGDGLVVTPVYAGSDSVIRITLAGGQQTEGRVCVIDEYSGLALVVVENKNLPRLVFAKELSGVGQWVLSAAGWGTDKPVVSLGILGASERRLPGASFPPLLQCDLRTTDTSSGAPVVNQQGALLGIVVVNDQDQPRGWTYAVPVQHVERLVRTWSQNENPDAFIVLKRRRPEVGMVLDGGEDQVVVERVTDGSAAERAGIRSGDLILEVDGRQIRSVYQALQPVLMKQPGDRVEFLIQRGSDTRQVAVVLSGGMELPAAPMANLSQFVRPKIDVEGFASGDIRARSGNNVREVLADSEDLLPAAPDTAAMTAEQKIELLEKTLERYRSVIVYLQDQLQKERGEKAADSPDADK